MQTSPAEAHGATEMPGTAVRDLAQDSSKPSRHRPGPRLLRPHPLGDPKMRRDSCEDCGHHSRTLEKIDLVRDS